jgi:hypothetical protein
MNTSAKSSAGTVVDETTGEKTVNNPQSDYTEAPKMTPEQSRSKAESFIRFRDMLQSRGLALAAGKIELHEQFKLEKWEIDMYVDLYAEMLQEFGEIPKWVEIMIVEGMILGPKIAKVISLRREMKQIQSIKSQSMDYSTAVNSTGEKPQREDFKKRWLVDDAGFFTHDARGYYVPQSKRAERPIINAVNYELLIKHNERELIERVFRA